MAPAAALAAKPDPAPSVPSAPPRAVTPPAFSTTAVYGVEVRVLYCYDESEAFSDEIEIYRETDFVYYHVKTINDVDGNEAHGVWVNFNFSNYSYIDVYERDGGSLQLLGWAYMDGGYADGSIRYTPMVGSGYEYLLEYRVFLVSP
jgi:hypothetical protein